MAPSTPNVLLTALHGLLKPRFLVVIGTVSVLCILGFHHRDLDTTYRQIPEHFERIGNKILNGENFLQSERKVKATANRLNHAELIYQIGLPRRKDLFENLGELDYETALLSWWQFFPASFSCPHDVQRVGPYGRGGKWICALGLLEEPCVVYSFGVSPDASFEREIAAQSECQVFVFDDPTKTLRYDLDDNPRVHLFKALLGHKDDQDDHRSWKTLQTLMSELGHTWVDIVTIDLAGGEHQWSEALLSSYSSPSEPLPFGQLQVRTTLLKSREESKEEHEHKGEEQEGAMHEHDLQLFQKQSLSEFRTWFESLENAGLRPFRSEVDLREVESGSWKGSHTAEYSFVNIYGDHSLLRD
ncbi:unnamed protein product [Mortierella alpina]